MMELPAISTSSYTSTAVDTVGSIFLAREHPAASVEMFKQIERTPQKPPLIQPKAQPPMSLRLVKVIIADPCDDLPLANRILHSTSESPTDLTDQELFFELDIKGLLEKQNAVRAKTLNRKASEKVGKDVFLDPIRVRDLKMVVVNVASF